MNKKFQEMESQLEAKNLPNIDWLQEGCYHTSLSTLISRMGVVWEKYTPEEKAHMSRIYSYPGGYFSLENDKEDNLLVDLKRKEQLEAELGVFKLLSQEDYEDALKSNNIELTAMEKRFMLDCVNELKRQKANEDTAMTKRRA